MLNSAEAQVSLWADDGGLSKESKRLLKGGEVVVCRCPFVALNIH